MDAVLEHPITALESPLFGCLDTGTSTIVVGMLLL